MSEDTESTRVFLAKLDLVALDMKILKTELEDAQKMLEAEHKRLLRRLEELGR